MPRVTGTVVVYRQYFTDDDAGFGASDPSRLWTDTHEDVTAWECAALLIRSGLSFAAVASDPCSARWAADPDGSYISDYATGDRCEVTATVEDFPERLRRAIVRRVG